jgi:hypothetical protein
VCVCSVTHVLRGCCACERVAVQAGPATRVPLSSLASSVYMAKFLRGMRGMLAGCAAALAHVDFPGLRRLQVRCALSVVLSVVRCAQLRVVRFALCTFRCVLGVLGVLGVLCVVRLALCGARCAL